MSGISGPWPDQFSAFPLLQGVGYPANRTAKGEKAKSCTDRQVQMPAQRHQRKINRRPMANQGVTFFDQFLPCRVMGKNLFQQWRGPDISGGIKMVPEAPPRHPAISAALSRSRHGGWPNGSNRRSQSMALPLAGTIQRVRWAHPWPNGSCLVLLVFVASQPQGEIHY